MENLKNKLNNHTFNIAGVIAIAIQILEIITPLFN